MTLSTSVDTTYADSGTDASVKQHQQDHDVVHGAVNALAGGATGQTVGKLSGADFDYAWQSRDTGRPLMNRNTGTFDLNYQLPGWTGIAGGLMSAVGGSLSSGSMYYTPIFLARASVFDRVCVKVSAAAASGGLVRLGLYAATTDLAPGALQFDAGTILTDTTGTKEITISQTVPQGWYFIAVLPSATVTCAAPASTLAPPVSLSDFSGSGGMLLVPVSTGQSAASALPSTAPAITWPNTTASRAAGFLRFDRTAN